MSFAQGIFERAKQIGVFLQFGELAAPAANAVDVEAAALAVHDTLNVAQVMGPAGQQLVNHQVRCRARAQRYAWKNVPRGRHVQRFDLEWECGEGHIDAHAACCVQ